MDARGKFYMIRISMPALISYNYRGAAELQGIGF